MKSPRTTRPTAGNKYYIRQANGGYSTCIQGKPTDSQCNVLSNCVGFSCGFYNEEHEFGYEKYHLNCNAENMIERAIASGLSVVKNPVVGGLLVWQKGSTLSGSDGAGHIAGCFWVNDPVNPTQCKTAESGWGSSNPFWTTTRNKGNGNWGAGSGYTYRGCIAPVGYIPPSQITPNVPRDEYKDQIEVLISDLRVRTGAGTDKSVLGFASKGFYNFYDKADANGYTWYKIADGQWLASNEGWTNVYPGKPKPAPTYKYNVGDKVVINGALYVSSNAASPSGSVSNKVTTITRRADGAAHPYNTTGDLGWMNESDIKPYEPAPTPTPTELKVGDKVKIIGTGKASSYGDNPTAGGIGWNRYILKIYNGRPYPYMVGANGVATGFYKADALQKL